MAGLMGFNNVMIVASKPISPLSYVRSDKGGSKTAEITSLNVLFINEQELRLIIMTLEGL